MFYKEEKKKTGNIEKLSLIYVNMIYIIEDGGSFHYDYTQMKVNGQICALVFFGYSSAIQRFCPLFFSESG